MEKVLFIYQYLTAPWGKEAPAWACELNRAIVYRETPSALVLFQK